MTLLVALRGHDGMVLASDSRGTFGDPRGVTAQNDSMRKLYRASQYVGILVAGSGEIGATMMQQTEGAWATEAGTNAVVEGFGNLAKRKYQEWFSGMGPQGVPMIPGMPVPVARPEMAFIVAGYEVDENGQPAKQAIYSMLSQFNFVPMLHDYGFALQGVSQYALYLLNRLYRNGSPMEQLKPLAAYVITETASQDGKVGGPIQMATVSPYGYAALDQGEIGEITKTNASRSETLRDSFFGGRR